MTKFSCRFPPNRRRLKTWERNSLVRQAKDENGVPRCPDCSAQLGQNWHADHIIPLVISGRTNVHEMRATCPTCNLRKGSKYEV